MFFDLLSLLFSKIFFFTGLIQNKGTFPKPLSPEDEKKYLELARKGDKAAKEILIKHNMRLVAHVVKKYTGAAETDDLLSVGSIGLIKAINTFQDGKGTQLATYTARCIENEILMLLRSGKKHKNNVSLTDPVGTDKDGNELTLIDLLSEKEDSVFAQVEKSIQREKFVALLKRFLSEREFDIISMRYGLEDGVAMPQREVAQKLGISRSYISRIEKRAIEKARENLKKDDFFTD
ncbi:MAG: RNA polymerase sporulation sigma factor SigK [Clostridia bacterium]|jgi:RNA polymerase sporulation-specific sigma factor|nr:RNA polymerase sporulation sigma factor SigK [Clostridia bacterium]